jgi:FixJ family two-component response regulator
LLRRKAVFVVDDDPGMLKGLDRLLKVHGFNSKLFQSVDDFHGRAKLEEAMCLVLDVNLNGKSGIELSRQLAAGGISVPVIFITANDSDKTRKAAVDVGCVAYLAKPFPAKSLLDAIEKASGHSSPTH